MQPGQQRNHRPHSTSPHVLSSGQSAGPRSEESWIEVSSQPSSSSVSSVADEIITDGLYVQHDPNLHRRRRVRNSALNQSYRPGAPDLGVENSSHDEYEESESESDRALSSNEALAPRLASGHGHERTTRGPYSSASSENLEYDEEDGDDDDENSTTINFPRGNARPSGFTPQPNAFSHPPASQRPRFQRHTTGSEIHESHRSVTARPSYQRHSYSSQSTQQHSPYNVISPSHTADHDAALRASLSTLLSCAAAARGLPRSNQQSQQTVLRAPTSSRVEPDSLRVVPESVAMGRDGSGSGSSEAPQAHSSSRPSKPTQSSNNTTAEGKAKRKASESSTARGGSKDQRNVNAQAKKPRRSAGQATGVGQGAGIDEVSPTLLTWVLSAGVVVLVSALSFSAGYVVGRETGRTEAVGMMANGTAGAGRCAAEVIGDVSGAANSSSLGGLGASWKRLRWGSAAVGGVSG